MLDAGPPGVGARLVFSRGEAELELECHPADAVGLAVRAGAPIYATPEAISHACRADDHRRPPAGSAVSRWLDDVTPADFGDPPAVSP